MIFRNYTPFQPLHFESRDTQRKNFGVVVARGTYKIVEQGPLQLDPEQEDLVMTDQYHGEFDQSSIRMENSIAPYKPATDIHLDATAYAPEGRPAPMFSVLVQLGAVSKQLVVTGERHWQQTKLMGWNMTDPAPCTQVPLRYELAYGGSWNHGDDVRYCQDNYVGTGYVPKDQLDSSKTIPAPRIMSAKEPVTQLGQAYTPEGVGPLAPAWQNRLQHAGTYDAVWEKTRWPELPEDFKFNFYNSAHPDLIYPGFVNGDEPVRLVNLSSVQDLHFKLPGSTLGLLARYENGVMLPLPVNLDTIHLEPDNMKAYLTWRGIFPMDNPLRVLELRMKPQSDNREG